MHQQGDPDEPKTEAQLRHDIHVYPPCTISAVYWAYACVALSLFFGRLWP